MIEQLLQQLIERTESRYFGKYRGYVSNVEDPQEPGPHPVRGAAPDGGCRHRLGHALHALRGTGPGPVRGAGRGRAASGWSSKAATCPSPSGAACGGASRSARDLGQPDSTARVAPDTSEVPKHDYPPQTAVPGVRMLKSATGHYIVLDDRPESARVEIHDRQGNRIILSAEGLDQLISNERTVNEGNRSAEVDGDDRLDVAGQAGGDGGRQPHARRGRGRDAARDGVADGEGGHGGRTRARWGARA